MGCGGGSALWSHPLPNHVHRFVALERLPLRVERAKSHPRIDQSFYKSMVLLHNIIKVLIPILREDAPNYVKL